MAHHHHHTAEDLDLAIDPKLLKPLFKTKSSLHASAFVLDWIIIFATIYVCLQFLNPLTYILAVLIVGARMHALAILMHDATHYRFLKNRKWNDLITNIFTMYPIFTSIEVYRENHMLHHRHLNTEDDPDWVAKLGKKAFTFPKTKKEFLLTVFSYWTLYQGITDAIWFFKRFGANKPTAKAKSGLDITRVLFYIVLFTVLTLTGLWKIYLFFWVIPYLSTFFMYQYIRSVAEHYGEMTYDDLYSSSRSLQANPIERFFLAPHNVGYHLEHHLYPAVPFYNLPALHETLMSDEEYRSKAHVTHGYVGGLLDELGQIPN